ncbi:unnamed protein product [Kuraishia capsulata CBS 1993]|uniref:Protein kinase domain-containing protein n=1 Tax=Kuraishia capsulata CBS 1993 TaxID=1382522 RepID=W6MTP2_9ASCO|nr:uncharacterized protein KUCA_T00005832001 [Kuraishia capsulata CBS 1993]CDK29838.1 unnamed protein product [Kuraishia capsulata CBS 1993]
MDTPTCSKVHDYMYGETLGESTFGQVIRGLVRKTGEHVAIKIMNKNDLKKRGLTEMFRNEVAILEQLNDKSVLRLIDHFEDTKNLYIVTQLAHGGELFDEIISRSRFTEPDSREAIRQILHSVEYLHDLGIAHRDIKPENILYVSAEENSELILADFGIAKFKREGFSDTVGSLGYAAPEVVMCALDPASKNYTEKCDIFSVGVVSYMLLSGFSPFEASTLDDFVNKEIPRGIKFPAKYWGEVSESAREFVLSMLNTDPDKRPSATELLCHPWMSADLDDMVNLLQNIREGFNARRKLLQTVEVVKLHNQMKKYHDLKDKDAEKVKSDTKGDLFVQLVKAAVENRETLDALNTITPAN